MRTKMKKSPLLNRSKHPPPQPPPPPPSPLVTTIHSFAIVIQQLPVTLRDPVCVFYLVLRALDTVEDDMAVPVAKKVPILRAFHKHCGDTSFVVDCGYGPYVDLMKRYPDVASVFNGLEPGYAAVIADITQRMGNGMADFIEKEVETVADYDLYCHYVAGLVGIGLSDVRNKRERRGEREGKGGGCFF